MCLVYDAIRRIGPRCVHSRYNPHLLARIVKNRDQYVAYNNQIEQYIKHAIKYYYSLHYKASMYAIFSRTWTGFWVLFFFYWWYYIWDLCRAEYMLYNGVSEIYVWTTTRPIKMEIVVVYMFVAGRRWDYIRICGLCITEKWKMFSIYLNSSLSAFSSCSMAKNTWTISAMIVGHNEVTWSGDMRSNSTRKQRNTAACTDGTTDGKRRLFANCSVDG